MNLGQGKSRLNKDECRRKLGRSLSYRGTAVWNLLLFIIIVLIMCGKVSIVNTLQDEDQMVNRLNYGVIFSYVGITKPTTTLLRHTFKVCLPMKKDSEDRESF